MEEEPECRICRDVAYPDAPLVKPCGCRGSLEFVHTKCLLRWLKYSHGANLNSAVCSVCQQPFRGLRAPGLLSYLLSCLLGRRRWSGADLRAAASRGWRHLLDAPDCGHLECLALRWLLALGALQLALWEGQILLLLAFGFIRDALSLDRALDEVLVPPPLQPLLRSIMPSPLAVEEYTIGFPFTEGAGAAATTAAAAAAASLGAGAPFGVRSVFAASDYGGAEDEASAGRRRRIATSGRGDAGGRAGGGGRGPLELVRAAARRARGWLAGLWGGRGRHKERWRRGHGEGDESLAAAVVAEASHLAARVGAGLGRALRSLVVEPLLVCASMRLVPLWEWDLDALLLACCVLQAKLWLICAAAGAPSRTLSSLAPLLQPPLPTTADAVLSGVINVVACGYLGRLALAWLGCLPLAAYPIRMHTPLANGVSLHALVALLVAGGLCAAQSLRRLAADDFAVWRWQRLEGGY